MKVHVYYTPFLSLLIMLVFLAMFSPAATAKASAESLAVKIASLELGMNGYIIGTRLSDQQKEYAASGRLGDSYPGTYKFNDNGLLVVVAEKDDTVLALYQRQEKTGIAQARKMISGLMGLFGEPTTMAHDQLIYWAYTGQGKIPEDKYRQLRKKEERLPVLATVKFNSSLPITDEHPDPEQNGTFYFIIASDPLLKDFMSQ